jgi:hypothetical protein
MNQTLPIKHLCIFATEKKFSNVLPSVIPDLSYSDFKVTENASSFIEALGNIKIPEEAEYGGLAIYIDSHGDDLGLDFPDHSAVEWEEFSSILYELADQIKRPIFLYLASCEGLNLSKLAASCKPCPFSAVGGSLRKVEDGIFYTWFLEFIRKYNETRNFTSTAVELRKKYPQWPLYSITKERFVKLTADYVISLYRNTDRLQETRNLLIDEFQWKMDEDPSFINNINKISSEEEMVKRVKECEKIRLSDPF